MACVLVTGSADGLGQMAARLMVSDRHRVVLHARSSERAHEALASVPGDEPSAKVTGQYFYHMKRRAADPAAANPAIQDRLLAVCAELSGVPFPP
jgi:NAD(P)-dependent dehydrogenase (short-subunit alcohol dehydrogenase family)